MAQSHEEKKYHIVCIEDENGNPPEPGQTQPEEAAEMQDPLDNLPDVSEQTGGLPIVTFVLICLSAASILLVERMLAGHSVLIVAFGMCMEIVVIFGIVALIRGMFEKLRRQNESKKWYPISAAVMALGIALGLVIGTMYCF